MLIALPCPRMARFTLAALIGACAVLALYPYAAPSHAPAPAIFAATGKPPPAHKTLPPI